jgi:hypothetical protein
MAMGAVRNAGQADGVKEVTVTDARDAVRGARVTVGTAGCTTDGTGACSIVFPGSFAKGAHTAEPDARRPRHVAWATRRGRRFRRRTTRVSAPGTGSQRCRG